MNNILKNEEAVSELIGAILLVAIAVILLGIIQTYQVPIWNENVEHEHNDEVYEDFLKLKTNIEDSAVYGFPKTSIIHMGVSYPNRVIFRNPADRSYGMLTTDPDVWIRINFTSQENSILFDEDYERPGDVVLDPYDGVNGSAQHSTPTNITVDTTAYNGAYAINISGNDWREQAFTPFTITNDTNMTVWIRGDEEAEIQAIGVAFGTGSSRDSLLYKIWGAQSGPSDTNWIHSYNGTNPVDGNWYRYELPIGADWFSKWGTSGPVDRIVYIQDNDAAPSSGRMYLDDLTIYNSITTNSSVKYTSTTISYFPNYYFYDSSPKIVYEHGLVIKNYDFNNFYYSDITQSTVRENSVNMIYANSTESSFLSSSETESIILEYIANSSSSIEGYNVSLTIHTNFPELWNKSLAQVGNITYSISGSDVTVTYPFSKTIDILAMGSKITPGSGASTPPTPTPTPPDSTPPASITGLTNNTYGITYINWVWTNPGDPDFDYVMIYIDGTWTTNTSSTNYNATGFNSGENHTISTQTVDTSGNVNTTWVNHTAKTAFMTTIYDATDGRSYFRAYGTYSDNWGDVNGKGGTFATLPLECDSEIDTVQANAYTRISYSDATGGDADPNRYTNPDEGAGDESTMIIHFWIDESVSSINQLSFEWEGYGDGAHTLRLYVFNYNTNNWDGDQGGFKDSDSGNSDFLLEWSETVGISNYINGNNQLAFLIRDTSAGEDSFHDYVKLEVTHGADTTPPVISNVAATGITDNSATITWDTDEPSDSLVKYGTESGNYTHEVDDSSYVVSHSINLTGLDLSTTYYYVVNSTNPDGFTSQSTEYTFTTTEKIYDASDGRSYFRAYGTYSDGWSDLDGVGGTQATLPPECDSEIDTVQANAYTSLSYSDATGGDGDPNRYTNPDEGPWDESTMIIHIWVDEDAVNITQLSFQWEGYGDASHTLRLYVFNYNTNNWDGGQGGFKDSDSGNSDFLLEWSETVGISNYINGNNQLAFLILDISASQDSFHDYAKLEVRT